MKRCFDIFIASILLILTMWLMVLIAVVVRLTIGKNVIFKQTRIGLYEKPFVIYKFITMKELRDNKGILLPDEQRATKLGAFLRRWGVDELPQLLNVLKGDMSLVGPRPLLPSYLSIYTQEERRRHLVRPGITGLAQIYGRNQISWQDKFKYDIQYVETNNVRLDVAILFRTIVIVIGAKYVDKNALEYGKNLIESRENQKK
ncbi:sugar transferase [Bacillus wiedmannii]|uniref:sugar transferase n=1 Tax=Bacillus wiedmannii TaxID=1890302 RepID=UPI000BF039C3|nr:hypothetical protein CN555_11310 [Bacillus wiedmannii]